MMILDMKRLYYLLLALPLAFFASCDDDNDLPEVTFDVTMSGGVESEGQIYVVQGETLMVDEVKVTSDTNSAATLGATTYFWNGLPVGTTIVVPFAWEFNTTGLEPGAYSMQIQTNVYQTDKAPAVALLSYRINVVASADDLPAGSVALGTRTVTPQISEAK